MLINTAVVSIVCLCIFCCYRSVSLGDTAVGILG